MSGASHTGWLVEDPAPRLGANLAFNGYKVSDSLSVGMMGAPVKPRAYGERGGSIAAGSYYYCVTALDEYGETVASTESDLVIVGLPNPAVPSVAGGGAEVQFNAAGEWLAEGMQNPGFEMNAVNVGWGTSPVQYLGWNVYTSGSGTAVDDNTIHHSGTHCAKLGSSIGSPISELYQWPYAVANRIYVFSFWTRGLSGNAGQYYVKEAEPVETFIIPLTSTGVTGDTWTKVTCGFVTPIGTTRLKIGIAGPPATGSRYCYFDDVSLTGGSTAIFLTWPRVGGATSYKVYRKVSGGAYALAGSPTSNFLLDTLATGSLTAGTPPLTGTARAGKISTDSWLPGVSVGRTATLTIAAADSSPLEQEQADIVCAGTDDEVTITNAIKTLRDLKGKIVFLPGTYDVDVTKINNASYLELAGSPGVIWRLPNGEDRDWIMFDNCSHLYIHHLEIDGNQANQTPAGGDPNNEKTGVNFLGNTMFVQFMYNYVHDCRTGCLYCGNKGYHSSPGYRLVRNFYTDVMYNIFEMNGNLRQYGMEAGAYTKVIGNVWMRPGEMAIAMEDPNNNFACHHCIVRDNVIIDLVSRTAWGGGIYFFYSSYNIVEGNLIHGWTDGGQSNVNPIQFQSHASFNIVRANVIANSQYEAIKMDDSNSNYNLITGNQITNPCQQLNNTYNAIKIAGDYNTIIENTVRKTGSVYHKYVLGISGDNNSYYGNVSDAGGTGVVNDTGIGNLGGAAAI